MTKERYFHKPTYDSLEQSLRELRDLCERYSIQRLAMPKIGSGLDKLLWNRVALIIEKVFKKTDISITVYVI